jgi:predicted nucleic acid-binding Zn ribbon protein
MNKNRKNFKKIDYFIKGLLKTWKSQLEVDQAILKTIWTNIVGERIASHTTPERVMNQRLIILADSAAWMNELTFLKEKINIEAKNQCKMHGLIVEKVVFKLGSNPDRKIS